MTTVNIRNSSAGLVNRSGMNFSNHNSGVLRISKDIGKKKKKKGKDDVIVEEELDPRALLMDDFPYSSPKFE